MNWGKRLTEASKLCWKHSLARRMRMKGNPGVSRSQPLAWTRPGSCRRLLIVRFVQEEAVAPPTSRSRDPLQRLPVVGVLLRLALHLSGSLPHTQSSCLIMTKKQAQTEENSTKHLKSPLQDCQSYENQGKVKKLSQIEET